jgi:hypothetical protein
MIPRGFTPSIPQFWGKGFFISLLTDDLSVRITIVFFEFAEIR